MTSSFSFSEILKEAKNLNNKFGASEDEQFCNDLREKYRCLILDNIHMAKGIKTLEQLLDLSINTTETYTAVNDRIALLLQQKHPEIEILTSGIDVEYLQACA